MGRENLMGALLQTINFNHLTNWSVAHLLESQFNYNQAYELVKIGDFLIRNRNRITIDDNTEYKRVTIRMNNNGIALRDRVMGKDIGTKKQFLIEKGQFLLSKIDARNGAFGLATDEVDGAIITADFFAYEIDKTKIEPYFLVLMTTTKQFQKFAQGASSGTTGRQRIDEKKFLDVKIPLPSLAKQKEIVDAYQSKIALAEKQEQEAKEKEKEIEAYLYRELGIELQELQGNNNILNFVNFKDVDYWSIEKINHNIKIISTKYTLKNINAVCSIITDGTHQTPKYFTKGIKFLSAKNVTQEVIDWDNIKYVSLEAHNNYCKRVQPSKGDILLAKNGTTGVAAIVDSDEIFSIYVSLALLRPIKQIIINHYLLILINSSILRKQFFSKLVGVGVPNLHLREIREIFLPLPELEIQHRIVNYIYTIKSEIKELKKQSQQNKTLALQEFEKEIFNEA